MLEQIIKMQCENVDNHREVWRENERIQELEVRIDNVLGELKGIVTTDTDKKIWKEIDSLFGEISLAYGDIYFEAGFKNGIKLVKEINQEAI